MNNRINLKELNELLTKEVQNGNGDAFMFVGEYYVTKDNYSEMIEGIKIIDHKSPYIVYVDNATKEKIMAINYQHVQKLTDEENAEIEKKMREKEKSGKKSKSKGINYMDYFPASYSSRRTEREEVYEWDDRDVEHIPPYDRNGEAAPPRAEDNIIQGNPVEAIGTTIEGNRIVRTIDPVTNRAVFSIDPIYPPNRTVVNNIGISANTTNNPNTQGTITTNVVITSTPNTPNVEATWMF